jgi:hypothetical protein
MLTKAKEAEAVVPLNNATKNAICDSANVHASIAESPTKDAKNTALLKELCRDNDDNNNTKSDNTI